VRHFPNDDEERQRCHFRRVDECFAGADGKAIRPAVEPFRSAGMGTAEATSAHGSDFNGDRPGGRGF